MKLVAMVVAAVVFTTGASTNETLFKNEQAVTLQAGNAYVLVRTSGNPCGWVCKFAPIFIRVLSSDEMTQVNVLVRQNNDSWKDRVQTNVVELRPDSAYVNEGDDQIFLVAMKPGIYILGGIAQGGDGTGLSGGPGLMVSSFCMGTMSFEAKPGVVTDMGTIMHARDDQQTTIPELSNFVTGIRVGDFHVIDAAVRPATPATEVPATLKSLPIVTANYKAVLPFPNYAGAMLGRLAPLAGVLAYDKDGRVIDLKPTQAGTHQ